jgi:MYXO-CTERM domain-containing protein
MQFPTFVSSRDHRSIALLMVLGGVGAAGLAVDPAEAALMSYTLDGGGSRITGSIGGVTFTSASWTMTATANSSQVQSGTDSGAPVYFVPTTVTLRIEQTSSPVATVTMLDYSSGSNNFVWGVFSGDYSSYLGPGIGVSGFGPVDVSTTPDWTFVESAGLNNFSGGTPGIYNNLSASGSWSGSAGLWSQTYETSGGTLTVTSRSNSAGTWTITSVPGGGVAVLLAAGLVRRRRR